MRPGRRCEDLYPPYLGATKDLKCRICSNLIYASQRYGSRHPLRKTLTPRKRVSRQKSLARFQQIEAKQKKKTDKLLQASRSQKQVDYDFTNIRRVLVDIAGGMESVDSESSLQIQNRLPPGITQQRMEALGRKAEGILKDLALNSKSKRVQNRLIHAIQTLAPCWPL